MQEYTTLLPGVRSRSLFRREDARGWLLKLMMREHIQTAGATEFGEIYVTTATPGQVKGNHYHERAIEWFCVLQGRALMATRVMATGETALTELSDDHPCIIEVMPNVAHAFRNNGSEAMMLLAYASDPYDYSVPDEKRIILLEPVAAAD
jgi:dTDP-4-dehydrorhamnose 3,5-epimerase